MAASLTSPLGRRYRSNSETGESMVGGSRMVRFQQRRTARSIRGELLNYNISNATPCVQQGHPSYCSPVDFLEHPTSSIATMATERSPTYPSSRTFPNISAKAWDSLSPTTTNDGFTDIFVSNDTFENYLFHNKGNGTFAEVAVQAGVAYNAFGNAIAVWVRISRHRQRRQARHFRNSMFGEGFPLYKNLGNGQFQDVAAMTGLASSTSRLTRGESAYSTLIMTGTKTCSPPIPTSSTIPWSWRTGHFRSRSGVPEPWQSEL